ncbi:T9SS type A sorting domain-containing protein [Polaribacter sp. Z022]|uniref:T9SS type A sorting domain-containing protein n=1 Tax=Polaribacter sp. Z022 TaxID=2927125 RepID=UPI0020215CC7|nr:T9SS type A sorting domain-containing protein [Polaribacter sp. Z022]MCL7754272.1 T9SS type A sorting domain-containing protein [Polaribacter sp. Z022]
MKTKLNFIINLKKLLIICGFLFFTSSAMASHFRHGTISWRVVSGNTVEFKISQAWANYGNWTIGQTGYGDRLYFGDGQNTPFSVVITAVNTSENWYYGETTFTHTYANSGNFLAYFGGCCKIGQLSNNSGSSWRSETIVNVGSGNESPVTTMAPIINMQTGSTTATFQVPASDPDGDTLTYRLATSSEINGGQPSGISIDANTGIITFNTQGRAINSLWNAAIVVEDGQTKVINDFIIKIVQQSNPPVFDYTVTPNNGFTYQVSPGVPVNFSVKADDTDPGATVSLQSIGVPPGANIVLNNQNISSITANFSWTPTASNLGTNVINFLAQDNVGAQVSTSVTILVSLKPQFDVPPTPAEGIHNVYTPGDVITYTVQASDPDPLDVVSFTDIKGKDMMGMPIALYNNASFGNLNGMATNPTSGTFTWNTQASDWGHKHVYFYATDSYGDVTRHEVSQLINTPPIFTSTPVNSADVGVQYNYTISISDADIVYGDEITILGITVPNWLTLTDNGDGTATLIGTPSVSDVGTASLNIQGEDKNHHQDPRGIINQLFDITVNNCAIDVITSNISIELDAQGNASISTNDIDNGSSATCGISTLALDKTNFNCNNIGQNTVTLTVTDTNSNTSSATAIVTVTENTPPIIDTQNVSVYLDASGNASIATLPSSTSIYTENFNNQSSGGNLSSLVNWDVLTGNVDVADFIPGNGSQELDLAGSVNSIIRTKTAINLTPGQYEITFDNKVNSNPSGGNTVLVSIGTAFSQQFASPNVATQESATFTVSQSEAAFITLEQLGTSDASGSFVGNFNINKIENSSYSVITQITDNCGISNISISNSDFTCDNLGQNTVTVTATDFNGNSTSSQAIVTVIDDIIPTAITQDITVQLDANGTASITPESIDNGSFDNCEIVNMTLDKSNFTCNDIGQNIVTLTVNDAAGNGRTIPSNLIGHWNFNSGTELQDLTGNWGDLIVSGNASISNGELDVNNGGMARTSSYNGPTIGNKTLVSFVSLDNLNVRSGSAITIDAISVDNFDGIIYAEQQANRWMNGSSYFRRTQALNPGYAESVPSEKVMVAITYEQINSSQVKVSFYRNGVAFGSYTSNNYTTWSANNAEILFGARHFINNSNSQIGSLDAHVDEAMIFNKTLTNAEILALYNKGNTATATVTVEDNILPTVITQDIVIELDANGNASITSDMINNASFDNCEIASYSLDLDSFNCSNVGNNTVTLTATDVNGNVASSTATVTVKDTISPTVVTQDISIDLDANGNASITPDMIDNGSNDACGIESYSLDMDSFSCANVGNNTVSLTVTDVNGNSASLTANVTVNDITPPTVSTQNVVIDLDVNGTASITTDMINNGTSDACGITTLALNVDSFTCANVGNNEVILTATDVNGNSASLTANVTVNDNIAPTVITQDIALLLNTNGNVSITPQFIDNGSFDNCAIASYSLSKDSFDCSNVGSNIVTLTVVDVNGNSTSNTATVTVSDNIPPAAIAQDITVQLDANGSASITANDIDNGSFDNCSFTTSIDISEFSCANVNTTNTVTLTVRDTSGNTTSTTANVTVIDSVIPNVITQNIDVFLDENGSTSITTDMIDNDSSDACGIASIALDTTTFNCANLGENIVTLTVTDVNGNVNSNQATVTVIDNIAPIVGTQNISVELDAFGNASITPEDVLIMTEDDVERGDSCIVSNANEHAMCLNDYKHSSYKYKHGNKYKYSCKSSNHGHHKDNACFSFDTNQGTVIKNLDGSMVVTGNLINPEDATDIWQVTLNLVNPKNWTDWSQLKRKYKGSKRKIGYSYKDWTYFELGTGSKLTGAGTNAGSETEITQKYSKYGFQLGDKANLENGNYGLSGTFYYINSKGKKKKGEFNFDISDCEQLPVPEGTVFTTDNCSIASTSLDISSFGCDNLGDNTVQVSVTDQSGNTTTVPVTITVLGETPSISIENFNTVYGQKENTVYLGYQESVYLKTEVSGGSGFTYEWTDESGDVFSTDKHPKVSPEVTTTYTVVVTNSNGCQSTDSVEVCVIDARAKDRHGRFNGKVLICHHAHKHSKSYKHNSHSSNHNDDKLISVSKNAVKGHLKHGDVLGGCEATCATEVYVEPEPVTDVNIYPNPSTGYFKVKLENFENKAEVLLYNLHGRLLQRRYVRDCRREQSVTMGSRWLREGIYVVKIRTGGEIFTGRVVIERSHY